MQEKKGLMTSREDGKTYKFEVPPGQKPTILLIDDDLSLRLLTKGFLEVMDFQGNVETADSGQAGIDTIDRLVAAGTPPTVVILDINLGDMSGYDVLAYVQKHLDPEHHIPFIINSAMTHDSGDNAKLSPGVTDIWDKPQLADNLSILLDSLPR